MRYWLVHPLAPLLFFTVALSVLLATYFAVGLAPSTRFESVASLSWTLLLAFWMVADARRRKRTPCFDFGLFCYLFLPFVVPWYCFSSRGWRGAPMLVTLVGLWLLPYIVATAVWFVLYG